jgi:acetylglutamate kinase
MSNKYASALAAGPVVVKYGGNAMGEMVGPDPVLAEIAILRAAGTPVVLVHGGGPEIDAALQLRGVTTERIDGMRVTDATTLEVTEAVLCATINKRLVRACTAVGIAAVGISGQDGGLLVARPLRAASGASLGYVGEIAGADARVLLGLLGAGFMPVVAPLAAARDGSTAFNVNADLAAAAIASALQAGAFIAITNVARVLRNPDDPASGIDTFSVAQARAFASSDACRSSMRPKLGAAAMAVHSGVGAAYIVGSGPNAIGRALSGDATVIR